MGQVGDPGYVGPAALGPPAVEGLGHLVEDARRRQVADQHQQAATRDDASPVERLQRARRHLGDLVGRGQRAAVGMVAVATVQPGLVGDHARLGQGPAQVVAEPAGLALGRRARERRVGEHLGEQAEQVAQSGAQRLAGERQPVGAVVDPQAAADALERHGELTLGPAARAEHDRARQHGCLGQVGVAPDGVGHPQAQVDQRHAGPAYGDHPQPVGKHALGDRGQPLLAGLGQHGDGLGLALATGRRLPRDRAHAAPPAIRSRRARTSGLRAPAAVATWSAVTCSSRSGISWISSARPRCCS